MAWSSISSNEKERRPLVTIIIIALASFTFLLIYYVHLQSSSSSRLVQDWTIHPTGNPKRGMGGRLVWGIVGVCCVVGH